MKKTVSKRLLKDGSINTPKFQEKERGRAHPKPTKEKNEALINVSLKKNLPTKRHFEMHIVDQYAYLNGRGSSY
jgi:hypothetical protein